MAQLEDFDEEARRLISRLSKENAGATFAPVNAIWQHEGTGAKVYVGNIQAAQSKDILNRYGISCVVNCQDPTSQNFHEHDPKFDYFRFPVAHWYRAGLETDADVLEFFRPMVEYCDASISKGRSVLIHCLAGAHRAGTTGVAYIMHKARLDRASATKAAKECRSIINPIMGLVTLLEKLDAAMAKTRPQMGRTK
jgi:protein-tyrosine phosphatase